MSDARALWAVRVLDRWAQKQCAEPSGPGPGFITLVDNRPRCALASWTTELRRGVYTVTTLGKDGDFCEFDDEPTPDAARIAAAEALVAEDPTLGEAQ